MIKLLIIIFVILSVGFILTSGEYNNKFTNFLNQHKNKFQYTKLITDRKDNENTVDSYNTFVNTSMVGSSDRETSSKVNKILDDSKIDYKEFQKNMKEVKKLIN